MIHVTLTKDDTKHEEHVEIEATLDLGERQLRMLALIPTEVWESDPEEQQLQMIERIIKDLRRRRAAL